MINRKRNFIALLLFFSFLLISGGSTIAQHTYIFNRLNVKDGLSQSSVLDIAKDGQGLMWFATRYGLNRYDGVRFKVYENNPSDTNSINHHYINRVFTDAAGQLWIGTQKGLDAYDQTLGRFQHFKFYKQDTALVSVSVLKIIEDRSGNLWLGTNKGLFIKRHGATICRSVNGLPKRLQDEAIIEIFEDSERHLWISTTKGLHRLHFDGKRLIETVAPKDLNRVRGTIRSIVEDPNSNIWLGSETDGLFRLHIPSQHVEHYTYNRSKKGLIHYSIRKLLIGRNKRLLIGTQDGISVFHPELGTFDNYQNDTQDPHSLSQNSVYSLYEDEQESLWVGTYFGGINLAYGVETRFHTLTTNSSPTSIPHNVIRPILEDSKRTLWFGTEAGGVFSLDSTFRHMRTFPNPTRGFVGSRSNFVKILYLDRRERLWVGSSGGGLYLLDKNTGQYQAASLGVDTLQIRNSNILALYQDRKDRYWVCGEGYNKVLSFSETRGTDRTPAVIARALANQAVVQLTEGSDGSLWILTTTTLFNYQIDTGVLRRYLQTDQQPLHAFNCMYEDEDGLIWIGVDYEGLVVVDPKKNSVIRRYTMADGLSSENVVGIVADRDNNLWITTTNGLSKLKKDRRTIQNYSHLDGIANDEFNYNSAYLTQDGKIILGSLGGLTWFFPKEIEINRRKPTVRYTGLLLFGWESLDVRSKRRILVKDITQTPHLIFDDDQNIFTIQFTLDNFIKSAQNRFMYRLEGRQPDWTVLDKPEVSFSNLSPGHYTLVVKGANSDGIWSDESRIAFTVRPPFYLTWWAMLTYALLLALFLFFVLRYFYLRQILEKEEEMHQSKLNFFSMISHEIRSHLALIIVPIENAQEKAKDEFISKQLQNAASNSERLLRLTSELIDFRKAETSNFVLHRKQADIVSFVEEILLAFREVYTQQGFIFTHEAEHPSITTVFDPLQLEKVVFNLLSNAVKHALPNSPIRMHSRLANANISISLSNYGKEIPHDYLVKIFDRYFQVDRLDRKLGYGVGLALSKQIMILHGGDITAQSDQGLTTFTLTLPYIYTAESQLPISTIAHSDGSQMSAQDDMLYLDDEEYQPTILILEDNTELMALMEELLSPHYELLKASNGETGVQIAKRQLPDLIISDVMMPLKNGIEVCQELKAHVTSSHIPIILLTAMSAEQDRVAGLRNHADVYLTKPFNKKILLLHIRNVLRATRIQQEKYRQQYILEPTQKIVDSTDERFLTKVIAIVEEGIESSQYSVDYIAQGVGMSSSVLYKKIKSLTGLTVNDFSKSIRLKKAARLLKETSYSVTEVATYVGFMDSKYFTREFKKQFGIPPSQYQ
ncbi:hybrid sensor histidine kinase/response regulator transcription factor [Sphingobacterium suaedae]|uniref:histidine kinase n=1 Tax=Sphingobacterium suaedae TaxID=1686402 RepID=A0ABW5KNT2_9SPHI